jgi:hypothetical protein
VLSAIVAAAVLTLAAPPLGTMRGVVRIPLPQAVRVDVDALGARLVVHAGRDRKTVLEALRAGLRGGPCVEVRDDEVGAEPGDIVVDCQARRFEAVLVDVRTLEVRALRRIPTQDDDGALPRVPLDLEALAIDASAQAELAAGERAFLARDDVDAAAAFARVRDGSGAPVALLRTGDLALARGDFTAAAELYDRVAVTGVLARVAALRLCALRGTCLDGVDVGQRFDPLDDAGIPRGLLDEHVLRTALVFAFHDRPRAAARRLLGHSGACSRAPLLCNRLVLEALREDGPHNGDVDDDGTGLALAALLPDPHVGTHAWRLSSAIAVHAARLGAPRFAADELATVTSMVPRGALDGHLRRTVELYLAADDHERAGVVLRYARAILPSTPESEARWAPLARVVDAGPATPPLPPRPARRISKTDAPALAAVRALVREAASFDP